jgi:hypothetical protein
MLKAYSHAAVSLNLARTSGCRGSSAICGFELSLFSSNSHHSSQGNTAITSSPCKMDENVQISQTINVAILVSPEIARCPERTKHECFGEMPYPGQYHTFT